jgi:hypothetical protein
MFLGVLLVTAWMSGTIFYLAPPWLRWWPSRVVLALSLSILPGLGGEAIASAATLQFLMVFPCAVVLLGTPRGRWSRASAATLLLVTGLTTPLVVFIAPLIVLRWIWSRRALPDIESIAWAVGLGIQMLLILATSTQRPPTATPTLGRIGDALNQQAVLGVFLPDSSPGAVLGALVPIAFGVLVLAGSIVAWRSDDRRRAIVLAGLPLLGAVSFLLLSRRLGVTVRYGLFPSWCVMWGAFVAAETLARRASPRSPARALLIGLNVVVLALVLGASLANWSVNPFRSKAPDWSTGLVTARQACAAGGTDEAGVLIAPNVPIPEPWQVRVDCDRLR